MPAPFAVAVAAATGGWLLRPTVLLLSSAGSPSAATSAPYMLTVQSPGIGSAIVYSSLVGVRRWNTDTSLVDRVYRRPAGSVRLTSMSLPGQVSENVAELEPNGTRNGLVTIRKGLMMNRRPLAAPCASG